MNYKNRGKLLMELCNPCPDKHTCKLGCNEFDERAVKVNASVGLHSELRRLKVNT